MRLSDNRVIMKITVSQITRKYEATLRKLEIEIKRRKTAEAKLKAYEGHEKQLMVKARQMEEEVRLLSRQVLLAHEEERKEISRELHDDIAQTLAGINVYLASLEIELTGNTRDLKKKIAATRRLVVDSVDIVHRFARKLRPRLLDDLGLVAALEAFTKDFTKQTRIPVRLKSVSGLDQMNGEKRTALYRVATSALTNVAKHARASLVSVSITKLPDSVRMVIRDNGKGFDVKRDFNRSKRKRLGLIGMRERIQIVGGTFVVDSGPGKGTTLRAEIPFVDGAKG
ncbi:MAG: sensor histidine kinase [Candidatus Omnitrophica bacterium]|nr:sensor histidine kinase [Candidatus Omnitrophota bacterium]